MTEAPRVAVIVFPGSNDDRDAAWALGALGAEASLVWHAESELPRGTAGIVLPGGFSYGDYLRSGAIARFAPIMEAVEAFARDGGPVLGICNGFQILCEAGLLPGALRPNRTLTFVCRDAALRVERTDLAFTGRCEEDQRLTIPIKHGDGCYFADGENPNGSIADIAAVANEWGNVMGLMPHPEHAVDPLLGAADGALILSGLVDAARERAFATV